MPKNKITDDYKKQACIIHKNKYDYSQIKELLKRDTKVNIICPIHGIFEQSFHKHLSGNGCKKCGIEKIAQLKILKAKDKFIQEANIIHNNNYDYSKFTYISAKHNTIIICSIHGEFEQTPNSHLQGQGCKKCANNKIKERMSIPWNIYKEDLQKIHNNKYDYSKVVWKGVDIDIIVECPIHGEFIIRPADHKRGRECQKCSKETHIQYNKLDTNNFIEKCIQIWGNKYDYSKTEYLGANDKVIIICDKHGEFEQLPSNHYKYEGCKYCNDKDIHRKNVFNIRNIELKEKCKKEFETKTNKIHNNKYDYSKTNYIDAKTKITIICKEHGEFNVTPNNHLRGNGCPECGKIKSTEAKIKPYEEYHKEFIKLYGDKYDYSLVKWNGSSIKISVLCKKHGLFNILPYLHVNGKACPKCSNQFSRMSIDWLTYMEIKYDVKINHAQNIGEYMIPNSRYKADGYAKNINTIFEFHGDFWHGNPKLYNKNKANPRVGLTFGELYEKTLQKSTFIKDNGYNLIEIWENDWKKFIKSISIIQNKWKNK
jgi:hypothetical protein